MPAIPDTPHTRAPTTRIRPGKRTVRIEIMMEPENLARLDALAAVTGLSRSAAVKLAVSIAHGRFVPTAMADTQPIARDPQRG